ncbi:putative leucine-rich repeat-containing, plant-type, leucine-rich repeat domain superfamily [Helianthus debilis subsp. tardiflorus]
MSAYFSFSRFSSCYFCLLLVMALFQLCLSNTNSSPILCMDDERQALLQFKHGLIDGADRLASWVREENSDCCKWDGIACDNITGHVHKIHLPGKKIPRFMGSLRSLRYLNLSRSRFGGTIPPQLGNLSELRTLSLGSFYESLRLLHHLDMSGLDLSKEINWLQSEDYRRNIPRCFNNFTILSGKEADRSTRFVFLSYDGQYVADWASLMIKGREDTYTTILPLVMLVDLSSNKFSGGIPSELTALQALLSLNLSNNQLTGSIPKKIGDMKSLESFDVSLNELSGELPLSLSSLNFLSSFNVSYNNFTGRVPTSTQLQSFNESSFLGNKLCGDPLIKSCVVAVPGGDHEEEKEKEGSHGTEWGLIISIVSGFIVGFWVVVAPLILSTKWRIAYFGFLRELRYMVCDVIRKYWCNIFHK